MCRLVEVEEAAATTTVDQAAVEEAVTATVVAVVLAQRRKHAVIHVAWKLAIRVQFGCIAGLARTTMEQ